MSDPRRETLTLTEIAQLANVGPSAVSNWRSRSVDFPVQVEGGRFLRTEVESWLRLHKKDIQVSRDPVDVGTITWQAADSLRAAAPVEDVLLLLLQLVLLRSGGSATTDLRWRRVVSDPTAIEPALADLGHEVSPGDRYLAIALEPAMSIRRVPPTAMAPVLRALDGLPVGTDWGQLAVELVTTFPARFGLRGAESFTTQGLADAMLAIAGPRRGRVYDPAAGAGTLLALAARSGATNSQLRLFGQDVNAQALRIARLLLGTSDASVELELGDTLIDDRFARLEADLVLAQPPLNLRIPYRDALSFDPRWTWGIPTGTADWLWVQHAHGHLAERGVAVVVLAPGILFRSEDESIRRRMLMDQALEAVVQLPTGMVPGASVAATALVLRRGARANRERVLFVDLSRSGTRARGELARLPEGDVRQLARMFSDWRDGSQVIMAGPVGAVSVEDLLSTGANLLPSRYIDAEPAMDAAQIIGNVRQLRAELSRQSDAFPAAARDLERRLARFEERR